MGSSFNKDRDDDLIDCPGESYLIERRMCEARRKRRYKYCMNCPENTDEIDLFMSPLQVERKNNHDE